MKLLNVDIKMCILIAAKKLFSQQGYEATTIRQICQEAGVNIMMVSYHFGGKENVLSALFQTFLPIESIIKFQHETRDPVYEIQLLVSEIMRIRIYDPEIFKIVQQEILLNSTRADLLKSILLPHCYDFRSSLSLGRECALFNFASLDTTLVLILGAVLLSQHNEFFSDLLTGLTPNDEELTRQTCRFVFNALRFSDTEGIAT